MASRSSFQSRSSSFLDGLEPIQTFRKRRISAYFKFRAVLVAHLGRHLGVGRRLPGRLHRAAPYKDGASPCALHRPAQAPRYERHSVCTRLKAGGFGGTLVQGAAAYRASAPVPTASEGSGAQPTLAHRHPPFQRHGLETDPSIIRASSLSTQRWAGGPHSVSLSTQ